MSHDLLGITSLPKDPYYLHQKLNASLNSFLKDITAPGNEYYLFVLENLETGEIGGICGIEAKTGIDAPTYSYRIESVLSPHTTLPLPEKQILLHLRAERNGPSEICSLYILPPFRKEGLGRLLSLSRFLFIAAFPERFNKKIIAEMRGYVDERNKCPFWEGLGRHFLNMEFEELMSALEEIKEATPLFVPHHPIYLSLLPSDAREAVGRVHLGSQPALNLLIQEGFRLTNEVDLFDGGPKIEAQTADIRAIKQSKIAKVKSLSSAALPNGKYILSNNRLQFRACYGKIREVGEQAVVISPETAATLEVKAGEDVRYVQATGLE